MKLKTCLMAFCVLPAFLYAADLAESPPQAYVTDSAHVIDSWALQNLEKELAQFESSSGYEIAIVTVPSLQGDSIDAVANRLFSRWRIGKKGKDNGLLVLVAPNERRARIEVGYGLEPIITDGMAGQIIRDQMLPAF